MKLILREDVYNLGKSGEVVSVKDGYARNYLLPRNLAMLASAANVRQLEHEKQVIELRQQKLKGAAEEQSKKLGAVAVKISRKVGDQDKLFGSVTALDIAEGLAKAGHKVDRRLIHLPEPIKTVGQFEVELRLHRDVVTKIKVEVAGEQQSA
ncbi:MAG: 50S ribosomal protein L9 [Myxococcaceae bacterium]|nr:50S ribosomal protein L9 [Myxococcaceae bacterium]